MNDEIRLDRSRDHGIVYGDDVAKFYQNGRYFTGQGVLCRANGKGGFTAPEHHAPVEEGDIEPDAAPVAMPDTETYDQMNWQKLRKLVKAAGGRYTTKVAAIAFLEDRDADLKAQRGE
jgi:hypothetical protein